MRLPFHNNLTADDTDRVVETLVRIMTATLIACPRSSSPGPPRSSSPTTGGTAPAPTCCGPPWATTSATPRRLLDVGSADGPSVSWMQGAHERFAIDLDPRGLRPGQRRVRLRAGAPVRRRDLRRGRRLRRDRALRARGPGASAELARVLRPGGRLLASVPAYQWAWSDHDVRAGHHRRYTAAAGSCAAIEGAGLDGARSHLRVRRGVPGLRRRAGRPAAPSAGSAEPDGLPAGLPGLDRVLTGLSRRRGAPAAQARPAVRVIGLPGRARSRSDGRGRSPQAAVATAPGSPRAAAARRRPPRPPGTPSRCGRAPAARASANSRPHPGPARRSPPAASASGAAVGEHHERGDQVGHRHRARDRQQQGQRGRQRTRRSPKTSCSSHGPASAPTERGARRADRP